MFLLEIYFALTLIVFIVTIPFYISRVRQNDYINMYYEMKEKFEKKYLNKEKKESDNFFSQNDDWTILF